MDAAITHSTNIRFVYLEMQIEQKTFSGFINITHNAQLHIKSITQINDN